MPKTATNKAANDANNANNNTGNNQSKVIFAHDKAHSVHIAPLERSKPKKVFGRIRSPRFA
jgi:hypothetical protein